MAIQQHLECIRKVEFGRVAKFWLVTIVNTSRGLVEGVSVHGRCAIMARCIDSGNHRVATEHETTEHEAEVPKEKAATGPTFLQIGQLFILGRRGRVDNRVCPPQKRWGT
jgi:hypothetical protein